VTPLLTLAAVTKRYRQGTTVVTALDGVSMTVAAGERAVVHGPSGSGKTTLLNLLLGWETADEGTVEGLLAAPDWAAMAVIPQRLGLLEHLTVLDNVSLPGRVTRLVTAPKDLLGELGLDHVADRFPAEISLGEQQRTACARALVSGPRVLLADEPTSHQDDASAGLLLAQFRLAAGAGSAVVIASHDARLWSDADRRWAMSGGRLHDAT